MPTNAPTCRADADDGEWSPLSAVCVSWVHGRPFRLTSGELYAGDWIYDPAHLANGGDNAYTCETCPDCDGRTTITGACDLPCGG